MQRATALIEPVIIHHHRLHRTSQRLDCTFPLRKCLMQDCFSKNPRCQAGLPGEDGAYEISVKSVKEFADACPPKCQIPTTDILVEGDRGPLPTE